MRTIYFEKSILKIMLSRVLLPIWPTVVYSRLSPTRFVDMPEEPLPGPSWVRLRNLLCGICASDLHLLFVDGDPRVSPAALPGTQPRRPQRQAHGLQPLPGQHRAQP